MKREMDKDETHAKANLAVEQDSRKEEVSKGEERKAWRGKSSRAL